MYKVITAFLAFGAFFTSLSSAQGCWKDVECSGPATEAFPGPWSSNIHSPASRAVSPKSTFSVDNLQQKIDYGTVQFPSNGSTTVYDFGIEVGGLVTLEFTSTGSGSGAIGLAFTEALNWIGQWSDASTGRGVDGALYANFSGAGAHSYTMPDKSLRGGFRYLTLFLVADAGVSVQVTAVTLEIGFQPTWSNPRAYQGYFHSNDDELNKIWYSGAYTLQTNMVPVTTGRWSPGIIFHGWANNGTLGPGTTIMVDGAKRDRAVWPGDMSIAVPSTYVSIGDLDSVKNSLQTMYDHQNHDYSFPEAGPPLLQQNSDTYHMWTLIGTYNYYLYTKDDAFLKLHWDQYTRAVEYSYNKVQQPLGLMKVTGLRDWARLATGGTAIEPNMILYRMLVTSASLATWMNQNDLAATYLSRAASLKDAINKHFYDASYGAFKDNVSSSNVLYPQDANSMSLLFGVAPSTEASSISTNLLKNWTPIGPETPELPTNISPFISGFEVQAHLEIGETRRALELVRTCWGWYLDNANGTGSTVVEGYLTDGSFGYRFNRGYLSPSYTSHAHGWSSGPTSALSNYVLGLRVTAPGGSEWRFAPQFGDLTEVQGGFVTAMGKISAHWKIDPTVGAVGYAASVTAPMGTMGTVVLPIPLGSGKPTLSDNGQIMNYSIEGGAMVVSMGGGTHDFIVS